MQTSMRVLDCQQYYHKDITFVNTDCLTALKALPDKSVALVVADPPSSLTRYQRRSQSYD